MNNTRQFDVNLIHEVAVALVSATSQMLVQEKSTIEAENIQDAIQKVLENHPEWPVIGGWITKCWLELNK